jgi:hypothetical protein
VARLSVKRFMAVTAIVRFTLPEGKTHEEMAAAFERSAPLYRDVPGLVRKYYLVSDDVRTGGGVYHVSGWVRPTSFVL